MRKLLIGMFAAVALLALPSSAGADVSISIGPGWGGWWGYSPGYAPYGYEYYRPDYAWPGPGIPFSYHVRPYGYDYGYRSYRYDRPYRRNWRRW